MPGRWRASSNAGLNEAYDSLEPIAHMWINLAIRSIWRAVKHKDPYSISAAKPWKSRRWSTDSRDPNPEPRPWLFFRHRPHVGMALNKAPT